MAKKSEGKHASNNNIQTTQQFQPLTDINPDLESGAFGAVEPAGFSNISIKKSRSHKVAAIATGIVVGVLLAVYLVGALVFSARSMPNTYVSGLDFAFESADGMSAALANEVGDYSIHVTGQGLDFTVSSTDASVAADYDQVAQDILAAQNPWAWPVEVFVQRDCTELFTDAISSSSISSVVQTEVEKYNTQATYPTDASVQYVESKDAFEIVSEVWGTALDASVVESQVTDAVLQLKSAVILTQDAILAPTVFKDDARLAVALDEANTLASANFDITLADNVIASVTPDLVAPWVVLTDDFACDLDTAQVGEWVSGIASKYNTVGTTRSYTREDGKAIKVSGGSYGWQVDSDALTTQVIDAIKAGSTAALAVPTSQAGNGYTAGGRDWGARYVDVDLTTQHATFYGDDGSIIWESDIVSGNPNSGYDTPQGVWAVTRMSSPETLIGEMQSDGTREYETEVQYWMPFKGNSVGFHDASWQSAFGGTRYLTNGSHGCINLPTTAAASLYQILKVGDVVVVHE